MPVYGQKNDDLVGKFDEALKVSTDSEIMYTTAVVNIRQEPDTEAYILGQSGIGVACEVLATIDGWAAVVTETGVVYMKADWLVDELPTYSEEDLYILAHVICGEAQGYSDEEQRYVASVVMNRVNHPAYPNTIKDVVFQRGQYSCTKDGNYYRTPTDSNWANARYILENGSLLPGEVVYQSGGKQGNGVHLKTNKHYYCYY